MVKIGVFGGRRGDFIIKWCKHTGYAQVVAVCEKDKEVVSELKTEHSDRNIAYYDNFDEFILHDMDAVVLANYAHQHAPYAIKCLNKGLHVLSDVLPCQCMKEAVELVEAVEGSGKIYAYGENYCYMPAPKEMKNLYQEGKLGELEYAEGEYIHNCEPIWADITYGDKNHWRNGMYATFYCTHSLGPLIHITGLKPKTVVGFELPFTEICARMGLRAGVGGIEMVTMNNGAVVRSLHGNLNKGSTRYQLQGSKGRMESASEDLLNGGVSRIYTNFDEYEGENGNHPKTYLPEDKMSKAAFEMESHFGSDYYLLYNFVQAVKHKRADIIDVYEALDMFLPGLFAWFSILDGNKAQTIPDLRNKEERDKWRNDVRCADPEVAGKEVLPSYARCKLDVPDEVYDLVRQKYLLNKQKNEKSGGKD